MDTSLIVSLIALMGAIGGVITAIATRRKTASEASQVITEAAMKLIEPLNKRIEVLEKLTQRQEKEIRGMRHGIGLLIQQLRDNHIEPVWIPEPAESEQA
jgi:hypothetical protein